MEENKEVTKKHVQCDTNHAYCLKSTLVCIYTTTCDQRLNNRSPVWHTSIIQALGQWPALKKHLFTECGDWNSENYRPHKNTHTSVRNSFNVIDPNGGNPNVLQLVNGTQTVIHILLTNKKEHIINILNSLGDLKEIMLRKKADLKR